MLIYSFTNRLIICIYYEDNIYSQDKAVYEVLTSTIIGDRR